jgi:hypothetical protein
MDAFNVPVLFLVFNRPNKTKQVFDRIRSVKPKFFYISADGPRVNKQGESDLCKEVRDIIGKIDWDCDVKYLLRNENLGCSKAIVSAIDWFFDHVEEGIILEDDCLPDPSFFSFCDELLVKYRENKNVMIISGTNLGNSFGSDSYYFSRYGQILGWATWRDAWNKYERKIITNDKFLKFRSRQEKNFWNKNFSNVIWDVQWAIYSVWKNNGIAVIPNKNLITNIGFGLDATYYTDETSINSNIELSSMSFPLRHPVKIEINSSIEDIFFYNHYYVPIQRRIKNKLKKILHSLGLFTEGS